MLLRLVPRLLAGERPAFRQAPTNEPVLPRRRAADGCIDWSQPGQRVYDFIRAITHPYPGAFSDLEGKRWRIWNAALVPHAGGDVPPGTVLGPVVSPLNAACGQLIACGEGAVELLELEDDKGVILSGRELSERQWTGKLWTCVKQRVLEPQVDG